MIVGATTEPRGTSTRGILGTASLRTARTTKMATIAAAMAAMTTPTMSAEARCRAFRSREGKWNSLRPSTKLRRSSTWAGKG